MQTKYILQDEQGQSGQSLAVHQGELKKINVFFQNDDGTPRVFAAITELVLKLYAGLSNSPVQKTLTGATVTLLQCSQLGGYIGFQFSLSAADTNALPVNNGNPGSLEIINGSTTIEAVDLPNMLVVSAPLVP